MVEGVTFKCKATVGPLNVLESLSSGIRVRILDPGKGS